MNDQTYYSLLFLNISKKDILNMENLFSERLLEQLDHDGISINEKVHDLIKLESKTALVENLNTDLFSITT